MKRSKLNFKEVVLDSLKYPFSNLRNLSILFLMSMFYFLIIPAIIAGGYVIRIIESTLEGSNELPEFTNIIKLLADGIKFAVVSLIYTIPTVIIIYIITPPTTFVQINGVVEVIIDLLINIVFLMAITNMVYEKRFRGAFRFKKIFQLIGEVGWKKYVAYLLFFTLVTEVLISICFSFIPDYLLDYLTDFGLAYFYCSGPAIAVIIMTSFISAYTTAFDGRLRGLIYPVHKKEE